MNKRSFLTYIILSFIVLVSRMPLMEKFQSHWDGPQYSIALVRYSLSQQTPAPPGYPLYIALGKFIHFFVNDLHTSIVLVSILAAFIGTLAIYAFGKEYYNKHVGIAASAIFLSGSTFYYFSLTPYGYLLISSFVILLALTVYRIFVLKKQEGLLYGLLLGICFGIRPQEMIFIGPLALLGFVFLNRKNKLNAIFIFSILTMIWLIPLIQLTGGISHYISLSLQAAKGGIFFRRFPTNLEAVTKGFLLSCGISVIFLGYLPYEFFIKKIKSNKKQIIFFLIWIIPGLLYNLLIRSDHAGTQLGYLVAFIILISYCVYSVTEKRIFLFYGILLLVSSFNLYWFFFDRDPKYIQPYRPTSFHYSDIRKNDLKLGSKISFIENSYSPKNTIIITTSTMWRPYMYYLKEFHIYDIEALFTKDPISLKTIRDGYKWDYSEYQNNDMNFTIPENIQNIILVDDEYETELKNLTGIRHSLRGNSFIVSISVHSGSKIRYGYRNIELLQP